MEEEKTCRECKYYERECEEEPCKNCRRAWCEPKTASYPDLWTAVNDEPEKDVVNHPAHYETGKFECFDVMKEALGMDIVKGFCLGNAFKYIYRCKRKGKETEDIKKAVWYLNKYLELEGAEC